MRRRVFKWTEGANPSLVPVTKRSSKHAPNGCVVGLDLSLRASACAAIPFAWGHDVSRVKMKILGRELSRDASEQDHVDRMIEIADGVIEFCRDVQARAVFMENHAFGMGGANANRTIEMTGIVKAWLRDQWATTGVPVHSASARKTLLQNVPNGRGEKKGFVKAYVARNVRRLGGPTLAWTEDEIDAFVVANHGLMVSGHVAMTFSGE